MFAIEKNMDKEFLLCKIPQYADNKCIEENIARVLENDAGDRNKMVIMYNGNWGGKKKYFQQD